MDYFQLLYDTSDFPARWHCGNWTPQHGWIHIFSDVAIWGAYMAIPIVLTFFIIRRKDVPFLPVFWLFVAFIFFCGTSHLVEASIFWWPAYRLSGLLKASTAIVSWVTVVALIPVIPKALALPSLARINDALNVALARSSSQEDALRQIIEGSMSGIVLVDSSGIIQRVNAKTERMFLISREDVVGQKIETLLPERFRAAHTKMREAFAEDPKERPMGEGRDLYGLRANNTEFPVEIGLNPITIGDESFVLADIVDMSHRRAMEDNLRAKNEEMAHLVYVISHDLKSPLVSIEGFSHMLREFVEAGDLEKALDASERISRNTTRMNRMLSTVVEYTRLGEQAIAKSLVESYPVAVDVKDSLAESAEQKRVSVDIDPDLPPIRVESRQLTHVLQNLIDNAIKYGSPEGGSTVRVGGMREGHETRLFVRDEGPGIDPLFQEKIFLLFQRCTLESPGEGIGLAAVKRIIELHGGRVWVESDLGKSCTFWIAVPDHPHPHDDVVS